MLFIPRIFISLISFSHTDKFIQPWQCVHHASKTGKNFTTKAHGRNIGSTSSREKPAGLNHNTKFSVAGAFFPLSSKFYSQFIFVVVFLKRISAWYNLQDVSFLDYKCGSIEATKRAQQSIFLLSLALHFELISEQTFASRRGLLFLWLARRVRGLFGLLRGVVCVTIFAL